MNSFKSAMTSRRNTGRFPMTFGLVCAILVLWTGPGTATSQETRPAPSLPENASDAALSDAGTHGPSTSITTGSGKQFKTTVDRKAEGQLSPEDFRQVSLLASRIVMHATQAASSLADEQIEGARLDLESALTLVDTIRTILPTTTVTTVVRNAEGAEVYRHVDQVQDDRIPLYEEAIAVNILEPITEAKKEAAELAGVRLADADLLHTSVLLELDFVERKLKRAKGLLTKEGGAEDAMAQLLMAQTHGISYVVNKEDNPLVNVQMALQLAERMVEQERFEAAKANLQLAKNHLALHRSLLAGVQGGDDDSVRKLEADITELQGQIQVRDAAEQIRGFWDRAISFFSREPGEARETAGRPSDVTSIKK